MGRLQQKHSGQMLIWLFAAFLVVLPLVTPCGWAGNGSHDGMHSLKKRCRFKNVIVMVPDGCTQSVQTLARWYQGSPLNLDSLTTGTVKTYMANSIITGSPAAATAFATGHKTTANFLSVGPSDDQQPFLAGFEPTADPHIPLATVLEGAKLSGRSTGLVATSRITHPTPAAYACHIQNRNWENEIMEQLVYQNLDVVFGGGERYLIPEADGGMRKDGEDLKKVLTDRGYQIVRSKAEMDEVTSGKVWGLFAWSHMEPHIDRDDFAPEQPSIAQMTAKAIELLSQNRRGFFLMVEGSQVDLAGHDNDPVYMVTDFLAFDQAVGSAVEFAHGDGQTLVLIFPDHNTGALSIGNQQTNYFPRYTATRVEDLIDPIKDATITVGGLISQYPENATAADVKTTFVQYWGDWWNIMTEDQAGEILALGYDTYAVSEYISKNFTVIGWTTHGHTGEDVPLWVYPRSFQCRPYGTLDNTGLARIVANAFGFDLAELTRDLFVNAKDVFEDGVIKWEGSYTDGYGEHFINPVLRVNNAVLPASKNLVFINGNTYKLDSIVVHAPLYASDKESMFIPQKAVRLIRRWGEDG